MSAITSEASGARPSALVTLGETMGILQSADIGPLRHNRSMRLAIAGTETNVAIGVRRLGVSSAWIGRVGRDPLGELIMRELRAEGVDVSFAQVDTAPTGMMIKEHRTAKTTRVYYMRSNSAGSHLRAEDVPPRLVEGAEVLHVTGVTPALSPSARAAVHRSIDLARAAAVKVSFDLNHRMRLWSAGTAAEEYRLIASRSDILFASHHEAQLVVGNLGPEECAAALSDLGPKEVVIKQGDLGYTAIICGQVMAAPAITTPVIDPVGAGDAFVAGYLASIIRGEQPEAALSVANTMGAFAVSVSGDWEGLPSVDELPLMGGLNDAVLR